MPIFVREIGFVVLWAVAAIHVAAAAWRSGMTTRHASAPDSSGWHDGGVTHTSRQIRPLPTPRQQRAQIKAHGFVTDNVVGSVGVTKHLGPPPGQADQPPPDNSFGARFGRVITSEPGAIRRFFGG